MISIRNLTKYYGKHLAVDNISFNIKKGEIVGFLGPNGAGKTTTMRMITGYFMPTEGDVVIGDYNMAVQSVDARKLIGYMPESVPLYTDMTTRRYLEFMAGIRGVEKNRIQSRVDTVVETCALEDYYNVLLSKLSKGYRQRVGLAQAIIHEPEVLILDEPTLGIDPFQMAQTRQLINELSKERTILLSTHILPEVSMICERVIIIRGGKIIAEDQIENLSSTLKGGKRLRLKVDGPIEEVTGILKKIVSVSDVIYEQPYHMVDFPSEHEPQAEIIESLGRNSWNLMTMEPVEMSLEDIFLQLTAEKESDR